MICLIVYMQQDILWFNDHYHPSPLIDTILCPSNYLYVLLTMREQRSINLRKVVFLDILAR